MKLGLYKYILFSSMLLTSFNSFSIEFEVDGIYYSVTNSETNEVEVTRVHAYEYYKNNIIIPETVSYNGTDYKVTSIGAECFWNFSELASVFLPNSVTYIGSSAFEGCTRLSAISLPNSVTYIGDRTFYYCTALSSISIPNSVTTIGKSAFSGCNALTDLSLGSSVESIGRYAFNIERLGRITSLNPVPPTCEDNTVFGSVNKDNCLLTIPKGTMDIYSTTYVWWDFKRMKESSEEGGIDDVEFDDVIVRGENGVLRIEGADGARVEVYNAAGMCIFSGVATEVPVPQRGIYMVKVANRTLKLAI